MPSEYPSEEGRDQKEREDIEAILTSPKLRILQQILATPTGTLSIPELIARNAISERKIRNHLGELRSRNPPLVTILHPDDEGEVPDGIPREYFAVTEYGVQLLQELGMYNQIGLLFAVYESTQHDLSNDDSWCIEKIEAYQQRPIPDWLQRTNL